MKDKEEKILKSLKELMLISAKKTQLPSLRKLNTKELKETEEPVNSVIHNGITNFITEMNNLFYAGVYVVAEKLGEMKKNKSNEKRKEPWWKRRIQADIVEWRKDLSRLNELRKGAFEYEKKVLDRMKRKDKLNDVGNIPHIDMVKEKISGYQDI